MVPIPVARQSCSGSCELLRIRPRARLYQVVLMLFCSVVLRIVHHAPPLLLGLQLSPAGWTAQIRSCIVHLPGMQHTLTNETTSEHSSSWARQATHKQAGQAHTLVHIDPTTTSTLPTNHFAPTRHPTLLLTQCNHRAPWVSFQTCSVVPPPPPASWSPRAAVAQQQRPQSPTCGAVCLTLEATPRLTGAMGETTTANCVPVFLLLLLVLAGVVKRLWWKRVAAQSQLRLCMATASSNLALPSEVWVSLNMSCGRQEPASFRTLAIAAAAVMPHALL